MCKNIQVHIRRVVRKHWEMLTYLFFGGCSFVVSITSYYIAGQICSVPALIANIISWILAVFFAYITNRKWVFHSPAKQPKKVLQELLSFFSGRVATLAVEEGIIFIFVTVLSWNRMSVKLAAQVVVIVLNYMISKFFIFRS